MQSSHGHAGRRHRHLVEIDAVVQRNDGSKVSMKLTDFSDQGCRMEGDANFHVGEKLQIAVERMGHMKAQVRWTTPGCSGTRFLTESDF
jgi:hypothetical protein